MFRKIAFVCFAFLFSENVFAQCTVTLSAVPEEIICGDCAVLSAFGRGQGLQVFSEDFNTGAPSGWAFTQQARFDNPCSPNGVDGTTHIWMGNTSAVPRSLETLPYDFSTATSGVTVCFDLQFATQTGSAADAPCEGPDEPDEGVYVQYRLSGGQWVTIHYFDPNGGSDPLLTNWNNWCFQLPPDAIASDVQIRWFQDNDSGNDYDHWGMDNVVIYFNDPTYEIIWQHDGFNLGTGNSGGENPTPVCPRETTDYVVIMTNGNFTCRDSVRITVVDPVVEVDAGDDVRVCEGSCATLNATAKVIKKPAKTPTYRNGEVTPLVGLPDPNDIPGLLFPCLDFNGCTCADGTSVPFLQNCPAVFTGTLAMNINIADLNTIILQDGELTSVCIEDVGLIIGDLSSFEIALYCPSGTKIILANAGDVTGVQLSNACFDLVSATPIANGTPPYTGNWQPVQPFTNLSGCDANGLWTLEFSGTFDFSSGTAIPPFGFFNGWNISFDDPEISEPANFVWQPVTGLSDTNSLSPTVCPPGDITYTLIASDRAGCVTNSDNVNVTVDSTELIITATLTNPSCGGNDGVINVNVSNGSGNYLFQWSNGASTQNVSNLAAGVYGVTITDVVHCVKDTTFILTSVDAPSIDSVAQTNESCRFANDGTASVFASGSNLTFQWSNGQSGQTITGLAPGSYTVTVTDGAQCTNIAVVTILGGPICCQMTTTTVQTDATCFGLCNGQGSFQINNGFPPFTYNWSDGAQGAVRNDLCADAYSISITDALGCENVVSISIDSPEPLEFQFDDTFEFCAGDTAEVYAGEWVSYLWSDGTSLETLTVWESGNYSVTVTDAFGCEASASVEVTARDFPVVNAGNDTTIVVGLSVQLNATVAGGVQGNYFWTPSDFLNDDGIQNPVSTPDSTITYTVVFYDPAECSGTDTIRITVVPSIIEPKAPDAFTPNGDGQNDLFFIIYDENTAAVKEFRIYNRWGQLIHDAPVPWDGTYKGNEQPMGTFVYYSVVELIDGSVKNLQGAVTLLR